MSTVNCSKNKKKRSLATAFNETINVSEPPLKKQRVRINKRNPFSSIQQTKSDEMIANTNETTFIVGTNSNHTKSFVVQNHLFCAESNRFKHEIESEQIIHLSDISIHTFEFITNYIHSQTHSQSTDMSAMPLFTFANIIEILYFADKYCIHSLIQHCKHKLTQINGNITDWHTVMKSFAKYPNLSDYKKFVQNHHNQQAISRQHSKKYKNKKLSKYSEQKSIDANEDKISFIPNDNDKKLKNILTTHGFTQCHKISSTGQGAVWRAMDHRHNKVVIKAALHIYLKCSTDTQLCENILNEVSILREINDSRNDISDCIIRLLNVIETDTYYMMVLEDGGNDLFTFVKSCHGRIKNGKMLVSDWQNALKLILLKLVTIMCWLHDNGYVHLDLSLENVCVSNIKWDYYCPSHYGNSKEFQRLKDGFELKLIDFGAAQSISAEIGCEFQSELRVGKPCFCAPQVFDKCRFDGRAADVWSFGVLMFTLIIGAHPWERPESGNKLFEAIVLDKEMSKIVSLWKREQYLSEEMKELLYRIFVIEEKDRATMSDIKRDLEL